MKGHVDVLNVTTEDGTEVQIAFVQEGKTRDALVRLRGLRFLTGLLEVDAPTESLEDMIARASALIKSQTESKTRP